MPYVRKYGRYVVREIGNSDKLLLRAVGYIVGRRLGGWAAASPGGWRFFPRPPPPENGGQKKQYNEKETREDTELKYIYIYIPTKCAIVCSSYLCK